MQQRSTLVQVDELGNMYGMLPCLCYIFWYVLNKTASHLGRYEPLSSCTKELHDPATVGSVQYAVLAYRQCDQI